MQWFEKNEDNVWNGSTITTPGISGEIGHSMGYFGVGSDLRAGTITAACTKLSLGQSTVSSQLSKLEDSLGEKLFSCQDRNLETTNLG